MRDANITRLDRIYGIIGRFYWVPILILFAAIRLFSRYETFPLTGDQCKYLALARSFPAHTLYNHSLYLIHPPLYGYLIGLFSLVMPLFQAGLFVSIACGFVHFFIVYRLGREFRIGRFGICVALMFLTLHATTAAFDTHVSRTGIFLVFSSLTLLMMQRHLNGGKQNSFPWLVLCGLIPALMTSDQGLFLYPCIALQFLAVKGLRRTFSVIGRLTLVSIPFYLIWPCVRLYVYMTHSDYPAGIDGTIEPLTAITLKTVLQPNFLPLTDFHRSFFTNTRFTVASFDAGALFRRASDFLLTPHSVSVAVIACLLISACIILIRRRDRRILVLAGATCILFWPCWFRMNVWYGLPYITPFAILLGLAASPMDSALSIQSRRLLGTMLAVACLALAAGWGLGALQDEGPNGVFRPISGSHFNLTRKPVTPGSTFAPNLPGDKDTGYAAPIGMVPNLAYLTPFRWIAIPLDSITMPDTLDRYSIRYLLISDQYLALTGDARYDAATTRSSACRVALDSNNFRHVGSWQETTEAKSMPTTYLLFERVIPPAK